MADLKRIGKEKMHTAFAIPSVISLAVIVALYSKILGPTPLRDLLTMSTLFLPLVVIPTSLVGFYFTMKKEKQIAAKVCLGLVHVCGLAVAGAFAYAWWNFGAQYKDEFAQKEADPIATDNSDLWSSCLS